jgi:hypothetical protein
MPIEKAEDAEYISLWLFYTKNDRVSQVRKDKYWLSYNSVRDNQMN